ncbi:MAG: Calx-beta domain-containing protein [Lysobacterales bacterium]
MSFARLLKRYILVACLCAVPLLAQAQCVSLTTVGSASTQNFDTLSNTAGSTTNNLTITGWFMTESGAGARDNEQYAVDTGGSTTGDTYSYGAAGSTERALGGLRSGTLIPLFGACFTNNTGTTLSGLQVSYNGEQWRLGTAARTDQIDFQYSLNATDLVTGTWVDVNALDFVTPFTSTTGATNGNAAANRTALSSAIGSLAIANGATFWIRWVDLDASGADDGLAVDDFALTPQALVLPTLSINDVSLNEGNAGTVSYIFTVSLSAPAGPGGVTFDIATADGTALAPSDYSARSLSAQTIPAGSSTYSFTVLGNGDLLFEPNETFLVNVSNIVGATVGDAQGVATIINDDVAPTVSINDLSLAEGNAGTTLYNFTVSLSAPTAATVTLQASTADNTATLADNDYVGLIQPVTILPGTTTANVQVQVNGDTLTEPNESFYVNLSSLSNASAGDLQGQGTIVDDDNPCLSYTFPHTVSGADNAARAADLVQAVVCANANGAGSDTIDLDGQSIALTTAYAQVFSDGIGLPEISTAIVIQNGEITRSGSDRFRLIYNTADLTLTRVTLSGGYPFGDGGAVHNLGTNCVLTLNEVRVVGNLGAFGGGLFNGPTCTINARNTLIAGNRGTTGGGIRNRGVLALINTTIAGNFSAGAAGGGIANAGTPIVSLQNSIVYGNESSTGAAEINDLTAVTLQSTLLTTAPGYVNPLDASNTAPTTAGDYRLAPNGAAVDAGDNSLIAPGSSTDLDGNPRRVDDTGVVDTGVGSAPIVDIGAFERQQASPPPAVQLSTSTLGLSEVGATSGSVLVSLTQTPSANVSIALSFGPNVEVDVGSGYGAAPQSLVLTPANAQSGVTLSVRAVDDAIAEANPHNELVITAATSSTQSSFNNLAVADVAVSIVDNDVAGVIVSESAGSTAVTEGGASDSYSVVLTSQPTATVSVNLVFDPSQLVVAGDGDGVVSLSFNAGNWNLPQLVAVAAVDDTVIEPPVLGSPIVQTVFSTDLIYAVINPADVSVTVGENDTRSIVYVLAGSGAAETAGTASVDARLQLSANGAPGGSLAEAMTAPVTLTLGSAEAADLQLLSAAVSFPAGSANGATQAIELAIDNDRMLEGAEPATLGFGPVADYGSASGAHTLTINDDESAVLDFATPTGSAPEASTPYTVNARLSISGSGIGATGSESALSAPVLATAGSASTPADYALQTTSVDFPAGSLSGAALPVLSSIVNDAVYEGNEQYALSFGAVSASTPAVTASAVHTVTIVDDDPQPTISISSPSQNEGNAGSAPMIFTVSLSAPSGLSTSFTAATSNGSAVAPGDYLALAATPLSIPAGQSSISISVTINGDTAFEGNESFSLQLTGISNATPPTLTGTGTILEDDQQPTTTVINSDLPDPSVVGQSYPVAVTVTAQSSSPAGTVTVSDGSASCTITLTAATSPTSTGSCNLTSTTAGAKTLTASYTASSSNFGNSSGTAAHQVNPAATTISVSGPARSRVNQPTPFTAALAVTSPGAGTPTGTITLTSGASSCTATLPATSCDLTFTALGSRTVSASYASDGNYASASSSGAGNTQTLVYALSDLVVTKTDAVSSYRPGELLVYTVTVRNLGPDAAAQIRVRDAVPPGLLSAVWTCDASGGAVCPATGGTGDLDQMLSVLPVGGLLNFTFYGNAGSLQQIVNTAALELPADTTIEDPLPGNNSAIDANLSDPIYRNGFEDAQINAAAGAFRLPGAALRAQLNEVAVMVYRLDDARGEALRVYARLHDGRMQYALALRGANGLLRLGDWQALAGDPALSWTASADAAGWVLGAASLR